MNDEFDPEMYEYDEDDEDVGLDEYLEMIESENENFEQRMERYGYTVSTLNKEYSDFMDWFSNKSDVISQQCGIDIRSKLSLCRYIIKNFDNGSNKDILRLWCICMAEDSDFLFDGVNDKRYCMHNYMNMKMQADTLEFKLQNEKRISAEAKELVSNFKFDDTEYAELNFEYFYTLLSIDLGFEGECFEDNLKAFSEKIVCSKELSKILPVAYYALFTRYRSKLMNTQGFEPNFSKLFRFIDYIINENNGKNIDSINEHIDVYEMFCLYFSDCDKYLCDMAFNAISNIGECDLADWESNPEFNRPLICFLNDGFFSCLIDNPFVSSGNVDFEDLCTFEDIDERRPKKKQIIPAVRKFLNDNQRYCEQFSELVCSKAENSCLPLVTEIIINSGADMSVIRPDQTNVLHAAVIKMLTDSIDDIIKCNMISLIKKYI